MTEAEVIEERPKITKDTYLDCNHEGCNKTVLGVMGAVGHSRFHGNDVTKKNVLEFFTVNTNPSQDVVNEAQKKREFNKRRYKTSPAPIPEIAEHMPEFLDIINTELSGEGGVIITARIKLPSQFLATFVPAAMSQGR